MGRPREAAPTPLQRGFPVGDVPCDAYTVRQASKAAWTAFAIAALLPRPWRTIWQATVVGMEIGVVSRNYFAGIKLGF